MSAPDDDFQPAGEGLEGNAGLDTIQDEYKSRTGQGQIPVQSDDAPVDDPVDANTANSDEQLARDDNAAIDEDNIIDGRTRGAKPSAGYREPEDNEGLPEPEDGTSQVADGPA